MTNMKENVDDQYNIKIGDIVYIELGEMKDYYVSCEGFLNTNIVIENFDKKGVKPNFQKC